MLVIIPAQCLPVYNSIELGYRLPSFETIEKIAKALRISAYRLFLDTQNVGEIPQIALIDQYNDFLAELEPDHLSNARTLFFKKLKAKKTRG
jgi:transcriptional regulator with XRE-family HTH domain